mgnify:CR=1 FL=1|jgi:hypothetical protein
MGPCWSGAFLWKRLAAQSIETVTSGVPCSLRAMLRAARRRLTLEESSQRMVRLDTTPALELEDADVRLTSL